MRQKGFSKLFKFVMVLLSAIALVMDNEALSVVILCYWVGKGIVAFIRMASEGGAFDW